jgi:hypothetical protein
MTPASHQLTSWTRGSEIIALMLRCKVSLKVEKAHKLPSLT